jgi:hypothetical protein
VRAVASPISRNLGGGVTASTSQDPPNALLRTQVIENLPPELNQGLIDIDQSFKRIMISGVPAFGKGMQSELIATKVH